MKTRLLLDTCVVSYWFKQHPLAELYRPLLQDQLLGLSFITLGELYRWPLRRGWGEKKTQEYEEALKKSVV